MDERKTNLKALTKSILRHSKVKIKNRYYAENIQTSNCNRLTKQYLLCIMNAEEINMSVLEGFKIKRLITGSPYVSVTKNGVTFTRSALDKLNYAEKVNILMDEPTRRMAIRVSELNDEDSVPFVKNGDKKTLNVRWNNGEFTKELMDWVENPEMKNDGFKVYGEFIAEENALLFDFTKPLKL